MELQSNENAALLKLLKSKSRTKTELLKVSSARRRARQAALDALLAEGKVIRMGLYAQTLENSVKLDFRLPQSGAALVC